MPVSPQTGHDGDCGRRMAETAAHLADRELPRVPVRECVLSFSFRVRASRIGVASLPAMEGCSLRQEHAHFSIPMVRVSQESDLASCF